MLDFFTRMVQEESVLEEKIVKLRTYLENNQETLDKNQKMMMENQLHHMTAYVLVIGQRLKYERELKAKR